MTIVSNINTSADSTLTISSAFVVVVDSKTLASYLSLILCPNHPSEGLWLLTEKQETSKNN